MKRSRRPSKDVRLVVRLETADLDFIREEGAKLALDASTWLRMKIRQMRDTPRKAAVKTPLRRAGGNNGHRKVKTTRASQRLS